MSEARIFQLEKEGDIGVVSVNVHGEPMNTWTEAAIEDFLKLLDEHSD